ncbi:MAG: photosystem reaction center subunit H [Clostridiaceae bacterium]|nr:photosystem reaction center subunit H [Clostridiaceae bacterium]
MHRYSKVLNLPVICADSGKKTGVVKDILFSAEERQVKALLLEREGVSVKKRVVLLSDLISLGDDAAIVDNAGCVSDLERTSFINSFKDEGSLIGLRVFSKAGGELGEVRDVLFDSHTGRIEGFEISDGLLQDVMHGRKLLPLFGKVELGKEFAVVEKEAVDEMKGTGGGIRGRLR